MTKAEARAAAEADDAARNCRVSAGHYRELGWQVGVCEGQVWLCAGRPWEALETSRQIGFRAGAFLAALGIPTPVIEIPGSPARWLLLTEPHHNQLPEVRRFLAAAGVRHLYADAEIDLPPTHYREGQVRWIIRPHTPPCPFVLVASAIMTALT